MAPLAVTRTPPLWQRVPMHSDHSAPALLETMNTPGPTEKPTAALTAELIALLVAGLRAWADQGMDRTQRASRRQRVALTFGTVRPSGAAPSGSWNEELVLQRYELMFEAGLVPEAGDRFAKSEPRIAPTVSGAPMLHDHRRILATGIARLRTKIK